MQRILQDELEGTLTTQASERLLVNEREFSMATCPLEQYFRLTGKPFAFQAPRNTMLYRGYIGTWEFIERRLYLRNIKSFGVPLELSDIFENCRDMVFAHWFSGRVYAHFGGIRLGQRPGESIFDYDLTMEFNRGVMTQAILQDNSSGGYYENLNDIMGVVQTMEVAKQ